MRDPDLVVRAQLAASALEGAWHRWRVVCGQVTDPMPAVSSYVGYSLQEPWGQPRVVFGLAAEDAEHLAALLERHDRTEPVYAPIASQVSMRDLSARTSALPVPVQASSAAADKQVGRPLADVLLAADNSGYDEPLYRQAAAAMKEAAAAREVASRAKIDSGGPAHTQPSRDTSDSPAGPINQSDRSGFANLVSPAWMGSLAMAATTAREEAEARIRAALTDRGDEPAKASDFGADAGEDLIAADGLASDEDGGADGPATGPGDDDVQAVDADDGRTADRESGPTELPQIYATDVLEPLPAPEDVPEPLPAPDVAAGSDVAGAEEPAVDLGRDDQDQDAGDRDAGGRDARNGDVDDSDVDDGAPEPEDHAAAASPASGSPGPAVAKRGRVTRNYPIARLSKTKRPGASSQPAGS
jgi:hypothetical protein